MDSYFASQAELLNAGGSDFDKAIISSDHLQNLQYAREAFQNAVILCARLRWSSKVANLFNGVYTLYNFTIPDNYQEYHDLIRRFVVDWVLQKKHNIMDMPHFLLDAHDMLEMLIKRYVVWSDDIRIHKLLKECNFKTFNPRKDLPPPETDKRADKYEIETLIHYLIKLVLLRLMQKNLPKHSEISSFVSQIGHLIQLCMYETENMMVEEIPEWKIFANKKHQKDLFKKHPGLSRTFIARRHELTTQTRLAIRKLNVINIFREALELKTVVYNSRYETELLRFVDEVLKQKGEKTLNFYIYEKCMWCYICNHFFEKLKIRASRTAADNVLQDYLCEPQY
ncbi:MAG: hypothetical protein ACLFQV_09080 [Vulcanimicrobiota bacterium]